MLLGNYRRGIHSFGPFLEAAKEGGGGGGNADADADIDAIEGLGDAGRKALREERAAKKAAESKAAELSTSLADLNAQVKKLQEAEAERVKQASKEAEADREKRGEFEQLAKDRETERDAAVNDLKELQARFDALRTAALGIVKSDFETLPEEVRDFYSGEADDPVAILAFIPKGKAAAEKFAGENGKAAVSDGTGVPPKGDTKPAPVVATDDEAARIAWGRTYR